MFLLILLLGCGAVVSQHIVNPDEFPETQELIMDLGRVMGESTQLRTCVSKVTSPIDKVINFSAQIKEIDDKVKKVEGRIEVLVAVMEAVSYIPYVGQVAAVFLHPAIAVLNNINAGLSKVEPVIGRVSQVVRGWTEPLRTVKSKIDWVETVITNFSAVVAIVDAKAAAAEACADELPAGRKEAIRALEHVSDTLDVIPDGFNDAIGHVNRGCTKVQNFLSRLHVLRRRRSLPVLKGAIHVLDAILKSFGPLGHFLDEVDHVLHKKFCLIHSLEELAKGVVHVGKEVIKGVEHVGKEVIKGAEHLGKEIGHGVEHFVDEAGHVWAEVEGGVEHVAHEVGKGVEHVAHEVGKGVEHVAHEVGKGVEHVAHEVGEGAEHVAHEVGKGVEHVAQEIGKGAEHVAHEVGKGVSHVGHEISEGIHHIGHVFHHIFGRRDLYRRNIPEAIYVIDGRIYALVDRYFDTRSRRGFDLCISVHDILKGVNFVTGGLISKAQGLIDKLFHGHSPFHIPGLTGDVLNLGSLFHNLDLGAILPSVEDILKLPALDIKKFLSLDLKLFEKMIPDCMTAFKKVDINF